MSESQKHFGGAAFSLETSPDKPCESKAQKRREKFLATANSQGEDVKEPSQSLDFQIPSDMAALQRGDPKLKLWFDIVSEVKKKKTGKLNCLADTMYVIKNGILYQC